MRQLPSSADAMRILGERRTRPLRRGPPPAGRALNGYVRSLEERFGQGPQALHARWPEIVGERLARVTEPVRLVRSRPIAKKQIAKDPIVKDRGASVPGGATLELRVAGPVAALVLHQSEEILSRANLVLGSKYGADRLKIVQGPVRPTAPLAAAPFRRRSAAPLDAAAERDLARSVEGAEDGLKASLLKLGRAVLKRS